ncbi:M48 family metallopeptidase [Acinetobacter rudis]|uniref:M48 family metallopeptidase n=1 Tax=Acinetobacter rudis TaxID=632955 RepID=A0AAW8JBD7_9GAMM|nr:M48 family metallopeptidase [Acinetobacter rudis]MDQ8936446.1 M48 family metallopeptidase [Acinetobacter rudis]MDQ9018690.1 M48 family metallopeptidase [Acinetobacter rudis]
MQSVEVRFYDGIIAKPYQAQLLMIDAEQFEVHYTANEHKKIHCFSRKEMDVLGGIAQNYPAIELPNDMRIEFLSHDLPDIFALKQQKLQQKIWRLERSPSLILFSLLFMCGFIFVLVRWGVPFAAYHVAMQLPKSTLAEIGKSSEQQILEATAPTQLSTARQTQIRQAYLNLVQPDQPAKLYFRQGNHLSANALALPNNTIIVTDELILLAKDDREILGVLAHEHGHLKHRHSLQQVIAGLGVGAVIMAISGDGSDLINSIPMILAGAKFSRSFEADADLYALQQMQEHNIDVLYYANFLKRLERETEEKSSNQSWIQLLASHPITQDRIQMVLDFKAKQNLR